MKNLKHNFDKFSQGFTIMEIVVATTIFAIVVSSLFALFNYTLKINRRTNALREASQGMRTLVEFLAKEIRNGQIDYSVVNGTVVAAQSPCYKNTAIAVGGVNRTDQGTIYGQTDTTNLADNRIGLITSEGDRECIYLADASGSVINNSFYGKQLMLNKNGITESLNPMYFTVDQAKFYVRPVFDPYTNVPSAPKEQPQILMNIQFTASLPTGEKVPIYYQSAISSEKYDIPSQ